MAEALLDDIEREQVEPLYDQKTNRLKPGTIANLAAATNDIRLKLEEGVRELQNVGPMRLDIAEKERLNFLQQFAQRLRRVDTRLLVAEFREAQNTLVRMTERRTRRQLTWTEMEEQEFKSQQQRVNELADKLNQPLVQ